MPQRALQPLMQSCTRWHHFSSVPGWSALLDGARKTVQNWPTTPGSDPIYISLKPFILPSLCNELQPCSSTEPPYFVWEVATLPVREESGPDQTTGSNIRVLLATPLWCRSYSFLRTQLSDWWCQLCFFGWSCCLWNSNVRLLENRLLQDLH